MAPNNRLTTIPNTRTTITVTKTIPPDEAIASLRQETKSLRVRLSSVFEGFLKEHSFDDKPNNPQKMLWFAPPPILKKDEWNRLDKMCKELDGKLCTQLQKVPIAAPTMDHLDTFEELKMDIEVVEKVWDRIKM